MISTVERNIYWFVNLYQRYSGSLKGTVFSTETINSMRIDIMLVLFIVIYCKEKNNANHMVGIPYFLNQGERWKQSQITIKARLPLIVNGEEKPLCYEQRGTKGSERWFYMFGSVTIGKTSVFFKYGDRKIHREGMLRCSLTTLSRIIC